MIMERLEQASKEGPMDALCRSWTDLHLRHLDLKLDVLKPL